MYGVKTYKVLFGKLKNHNFITFIACGICLEFFLFYSMYSREILQSVPSAFDQVGYMLQSYDLFENWLNGNYAEIFRYIKETPNGCLIQIMGVFNLLVFGKSRFSLILINFEAMVITQIFCGILIYKITNSRYFSFIFNGMFFLISGIYFWAGGLSDYRLDFSLFCLYTCWGGSYLLLKSKYKLKYLVIFITLSVIMILCRPITAVYIGLNIILIELINGLLLKERAYNIIREIIKLGLIILAFSGLYLVLIFKSLYNYYIVGHIISDEKNIRAAEQGVNNFVDNILYYPNSIIKNHLSVEFIFITIMIFILTVIFVIYRRKKYSYFNFPINKFLLLLCLIIIPIIILTCDKSKSPIVGNIVTGIIALLDTFLLYILYINNFFSKKILIFISLVIASVGSINYFQKMSTKQLNYGASQDVQRGYVKINNAIANYSDKNNLDKLTMLVDRVDGYINTGTVSLNVYEQYNKMITIEDAIDVNIESGEASAIMHTFDENILEKALINSDIIVISRNGYEEKSTYPKDMNLDLFRNKIFNYAQFNLQQIEQVSINNAQIYVFAREKVEIENDFGGGGWITDKGLVLKINKLNKYKAIELIGNFNSEILPNELDVICTNESGIELPTSIEFDFTKEKYKIEIDITLEEIGVERINLVFNKYTIPAEIGYNEDTRKLVMCLPDSLNYK